MWDRKKVKYRIITKSNVVSLFITFNDFILFAFSQSDCDDYQLGGQLAITRTT